MRKGLLLKNTALLTGTSLMIRWVGMIFQVWLVGRIGATGIGLYQLVMSVGMLAATFAISGIRFASTRLIAEELGLGRSESVGAAARRCLVYAASFGMAACVILLLLAEPVGFLWIGDARTVPSLNYLAFSLPFLALNGVFCGYFNAVGRVWKSSIAQIVEQFIRIFLVVFFLNSVPLDNITASCAAVTKGATLGEALSCLLLTILFLRDRMCYHPKAVPVERLTGRMLRIALPLAFSAYARTSLSTAEHLLVPRQLRRSGLSADAALTGYGAIHGMIFPILTFPSCLLSTLAEILVPTLTAAQMRGDKKRIRTMVHKLLIGTGLFTSLVTVVIYWGADWLGMRIYGEAKVGTYLRTFAFLIPVIYLDIIVDGCLKGLGQMMHSMAYNIMDAALGVGLVILLLPRWALNGYIAVVFITEVFNTTLSAVRLWQVLHPKDRNTPVKSDSQFRSRPNHRSRH